MLKIRHLHVPVFLTGVLLTLVLVTYSAWSTANQRRADALRTAEVYSARLETLLNALFHKTDVLESIIIAEHGAMPEDVFHDLARSLSDGEGIRAIQYLPDGVVTYCYPREGNEAVMGTSVFTNPKRRADALLAVNSRGTVLSGPYELSQGGLGLVARNPIFLTDADGREKFWGFAVLILDLPDALKPVFLDALQQEGYAYRLFSQGEAGRHQTIAQGGVLPAGSGVDYGIKVPNHVWTLSLAPEGGWINMAELSLQLGLGFFISGLCAVLAHERREKERLLRRTAESDDLTGLFNRRKLGEMVDARRNAPQAAPFLLLYMDLNGFKACNDTLGHFWGDVLLKAFAQRMRSALGPQAGLARVGGDEFAALIDADQGQAALPDLLRRIQQSLREPVMLGDAPQRISCSVGWAEFPGEGRDYDTLMKKADARMYEEKRRYRAGEKHPETGV